MHTCLVSLKTLTFALSMQNVVPSCQRHAASRTHEKKDTAPTATPSEVEIPYKAIHNGKGKYFKKREDQLEAPATPPPDQTD